MSVVAFVAFEGFFAACLSRQGSPGALAVIQKLHPLSPSSFREKRGGGMVLDASPEAKKLGIRPGMASSEARYAARAGQVRFVEYREEEYAEAARGWLDVCAEYASAVEPLAPHMAFLDLSGLAGARQIATALSADLYRAARLCPRVGIAGSKLVSRLANGAIAEGADKTFLSSLPIESLWLAKREHLERLRFLGYRTIGDIAALPRELLIKQFGQMGLQISLWANGVDRSKVRALYPPDELYARFHFSPSARADAEIEAGLRILAEHLSSLLCARDSQTGEVFLTITFEDNSLATTRRSFVKPMQSVWALLTGLRLTLRQIDLVSDVASLSARLLKVQKSDRKQLVISAESKDASNVVAALQNLQAVFGKESLKSGSEVVVPRRQRVLREFLRLKTEDCRLQKGISLQSSVRSLRSEDSP